MPRIAKTLEYRRVSWLAYGQNLEQSVRDAWGQFATQQERTVTRTDRRATVGLLSHDYNRNGIAIHCASYTDQQGVGTIPMVPAAAATVGEQLPERGENFLNSDFMGLIKDNHVVCLNCGRNGASLRNFLAELFRMAGLADETQQFELVRIGSPDKIAMIESLGVKKIDMNISIADATAIDLIDEAPREGMWHEITRAFGTAFSSVTTRDVELSHIQLAEQGTVTVSINVNKGDLQVARHGLNHFAEEIVNDEESDGFVIHLRDGKTTIKSDEVSVRKQVRLEAAANTVSVQEAWDAMNAYYRELAETGQIEA